MSVRGVNWSVAVDEGGRAYVRACRCSACQAVVTEARVACPSCGKRGTLAEFEVAKDGVLHAWSIVHRSFPGVAVPFISAIVDMKDGTVLKGNLRGVAPKPEAIQFGMPVRVVLDDAGRKDAEGNSYISYFFEAA
ncbi:MAG: Zn-ribbon domain-containing OB-fold protein [Hyphomonadaceae bacterium]